MPYKQFAFTSSAHRDEVKFIQRVHKSAQPSRVSIAHAIRAAVRSTPVVNPRSQPSRFGLLFSRRSRLRPDPDHRCSIAMACTAAIAYAPPWYLHRSAHRSVRAALGANANLRRHYPSARPRLCRSRACGRRPNDRLIPAILDTLTGYARGPLYSGGSNTPQSGCGVCGKGKGRKHVPQRSLWSVAGWSASSSSIWVRSSPGFTGLWMIAAK